MLFHGKQHEQHERLVTIAARLHLGIGLDGEVHEQEVLENSLFVPFGILFGPVVDPLFNLVLSHVLLGVDVTGSDFNGKTTLFVEPGAELLELHVSPKRLEFVDVVFHLLGRLALLHVLDPNYEVHSGLVQDVRGGGGSHW